MEKEVVVQVIALVVIKGVIKISNYNNKGVLDFSRTPFCTILFDELFFYSTILRREKTDLKGIVYNGLRFNKCKYRYHQ